MKKRNVWKTKPFPFQREGMRMIHKKEGVALLADDMGLGKSFQAIGYAKKYLKRGAILIVCPAYLKWQWKRECLVHVGFQSKILETRKASMKALKGNLNKRPIFIINYEILKDWEKCIRKANIVLVIADECQAFQSPSSQRTKAMRKIAEKVPKRIFMSGTPADRSIDLWPVLNMLWPKQFPSYMRFGYRYCCPKMTPWGIKFPGSRRLKELHRKLRRLGMIRRKKSDVLDQLPAKRRIVIPIDLPPKVMKEYREIEQNFVHWLAKTHPKKARRSRRSLMLAKFGYLKRFVAEHKLPFCKNWIDDFLVDNPKGKLIAFGLHKKIVRGMQELYPKQSVVVDGKVSNKSKPGEPSKRQKAFDQFLKRKDIPLLFGNMQAAGTGWSARGVSKELFLELAFKPGHHTQAEDRTHGLKRGEDGVPSEYYYIIARGTIEEPLCEMLQEKQTDSDLMMDGKESDDGLNILDRLEELYLKKGGF